MYRGRRLKWWVLYGTPRVPPPDNFQNFFIAPLFLTELEMCPRVAEGTFFMTSPVVKA